MVNIYQNSEEDNFCVSPCKYTVAAIENGENKKIETKEEPMLSPVISTTQTEKKSRKFFVKQIGEII